MPLPLGEVVFRPMLVMVPRVLDAIVEVDVRFASDVVLKKPGSDGTGAPELGAVVVNTGVDLLGATNVVGGVIDSEETLVGVVSAVLVRPLPEVGGALNERPVELADDTELLMPLLETGGEGTEIIELEGLKGEDNRELPVVEPVVDELVLVLALLGDKEGALVTNLVEELSMRLADVATMGNVGEAEEDTSEKDGRLTPLDLGPVEDAPNPVDEETRTDVVGNEGIPDGTEPEPDDPGSETRTDVLGAVVAVVPVFDKERADVGNGADNEIEKRELNRPDDDVGRLEDGRLAN